MSDAYIREAGKAMIMFIEQASDRLASKCESPIEVGFLQGLIAVHLCDPRLQIEGFPRPKIASPCEAMVFIQHKVGDYRLDFAVHVTCQSDERPRSAWIAIECDGHEFHERTKEQAARDKARDRALTAKGFRILRFAGSEIYESSFACAADVLQLVRSIINEWEDE